jgi:hypothetical protein
MDHIGNKKTIRGVHRQQSELTSPLTKIRWNMQTDRRTDREQGDLIKLAFIFSK